MILDATCGPRKMYLGRDQTLSNPQEILFLDKRAGVFIWKTSPKAKVQDRRVYDIRPSVQADLTRIPFREKLFSFIILDPPHGRFGRTSKYAKQYGTATKEELIDLFRDANQSFYRVLKDDGIVIAKISDIDQKNSEIIEEEFTNFNLFLKFDIQSRRKTRKSSTYLLLFLKKEVNIL